MSETNGKPKHASVASLAARVEKLEIQVNNLRTMLAKAMAQQAAKAMVPTTEAELEAKIMAAFDNPAGIAELKS